MVVGVMIGSTTLGASTVLDALWGRVTGREATGAVADQIVWQIRLPRVLLAAVVGAALTTSGTVVIAHHVVGSPATCVDRLATIVEHTAVARVVLVVEAAVTPAAVLDNVRRLGREVLPHVRERLRAEEDQSSMRIESNMASRSAMS